MNALDGWAERIRRGERIPWPLALALAAATPVVRAGMMARLSLPRVRVDARVISFGNLTAGGTGKTPAVIERARKEIAAGRKVAVLTRGYGSKKGAAYAWKPGGQIDVPFLCRVLGDEPALIALKVPEAVVVKNRDRVAGAQAAIEQHGCDTLILDDGFQYVRLERDENILLIDATNPFGNGHLIPRGLLREPLRAMARATAIILTHCDQAADLSPVLAQVKALAPHAPIRRTRHAPAGFYRFSGGPPLPCTAVAGKRVRAVC
jgi:tetraacyldisaccharide 4'-kinase